MTKRNIAYLVITLAFIIISIVILRHTDLSNNVLLSKSIEIIIVLYLMRISYGCATYIRKQFQKKKYSYGIIMNLALLIFININIFRHINLLIVNWNNASIVDVYNNTLESFSFFAMLTLPCIVILSIYSIITNIILIKKEGKSYKNLLGIVLGVFAIFGLFGHQTIYMITSILLAGNKLMVVKKLIDIMINVTMSYFYTLIISTLYCNIKAAKHIPELNKDYVIILGCLIRKDGTLTPLLKARADKAIEFAKMQKERTGKSITFVPSGGKGNDEIIAEGVAIKNYLVESGIDESCILVEDGSTSTLENLKYSNALITKENIDAKICFSTTNYHVFRSGVIANDCGIDCEGMGSKTKWYFYTNALIREFIANIVHEAKKHITLISIMNASAVFFVFIGYYFKLIKF